MTRKMTSYEAEQLMNGIAREVADDYDVDYDYYGDCWAVEIDDLITELTLHAHDEDEIEEIEEEARKVFESYADAEASKTEYTVEELQDERTFKRFKSQLSGHKFDNCHNINEVINKALNCQCYPDCNLTDKEIYEKKILLKDGGYYEAWASLDIELKCGSFLRLYGYETFEGYDTESERFTITGFGNVESIEII